ncbi:MAG: SDR family oxidoreductase [Dehalococcoidia bacterium]|nr:SDR family oxidoreductase [Dehalococcoidia bacterium]
MDIRFDGQVALVTGAGRGLGRSYALELARRGAKVIINDIGGALDGESADQTPAQQVVDEIKAEGGEAAANYDSVADYEGGYNMVKQAIDTWGRLDIAVCNAGILRDRAIHNMPEEDWDKVLDVHLKGCYNVIRAAWPVFRQQSYGRVVMASSNSGLYGNFGQANYAAAKAGMVGMMNVLKLEGEKYNINVHCIAPGAATRMTENLMDAERLALMSPDHVAPIVAYLASSECEESGLVIEAAAGRYGRCSFVKGPTVEYDPTDLKSVEWVRDNWDKITSLDGADPMWSVRESRKEHYAKA